MDTLLDLDKKLFHILNESIANPFFDFIMPIVTNQKYLVPAYIVCIVLLMIFGKKKGIILGIGLLLVAGITDLISSQVLKEYFGRIRPCNDLDVRLLVHCGGGKSFPSSHAANNYALAAFASIFFKKYKIYFFGFAALVAFSRIYVGVHYPLDVLGGGLLGMMIGVLISIPFSLILKKLDKTKLTNHR